MTTTRIPTRAAVYPDGTIFCGFVVTATECRAVYTHAKFVLGQTRVEGRRRDQHHTLLVHNPSATVALFENDTLLEEGWHIPALAEGMLVQMLGLPKTPSMFKAASPTIFYNGEHLEPAIIGVGALASVQGAEFAKTLVDRMVPTASAITHNPYLSNELRWAYVSSNFNGGVMIFSEQISRLMVRVIPVRSERVEL